MKNPTLSAGYDRLRTLIYEESGIRLTDARLPHLAAGLGWRMHVLKEPSHDAYLARAADRSSGELEELLESVVTGETAWFRDQAQFDFFSKNIFPEWRRNVRDGRRSVRAWSAGCATGEEVYSLAMLVLDHFPGPSGWSVDVLGSDLSRVSLARAREGVWPIAAADDLPSQYPRRFMLRGYGAEEGSMKAGSLLRTVTEFRRINLNIPPYPTSGAFDLIFCRNVLIYFDAASAGRVIRALTRCLADGGYLVVGSSEVLMTTDPRLQRVAPGIYELKEKADR